MSIFVLGIDLGKNVCSLVGLDETGAVVMRRRLRRDCVVDFVGKLEPCIMVMEDCCGAHHLGQVLGSKGHKIRLMSPESVRPYMKANKNDDHDAEAIAEAATRPTIRFVPVKSEAQSDIQALHRARSRLVAERTALINHLGALLLGHGIVVAQGRRKLEDLFEVSLMRTILGYRHAYASLSRTCAPSGVASTNGLLSSMPNSCTWRVMTTRPVAFRRSPVSGSSALPRLLPRSAARRASGAGVTSPPAWASRPRQATTGGKPRLLGISKRGNCYLRGTALPA